MNIKLLNKVKKAILKEPRAFHMSSWHETWEEGDREDGWCGTSHCIGGWAQVLSGKKKGHVHSSESFAYYQELLQLPDLNLLIHDLWPRPLHKRYENAVSEEDWDAAANVAAEAIDSYIQHHSNPPKYQW